MRNLKDGQFMSSSPHCSWDCHFLAPWDVTVCDIPHEVRIWLKQHDVEVLHGVNGLETWRVFEPYALWLRRQLRSTSCQWRIVTDLVP